MATGRNPLRFAAPSLPLRALLAFALMGCALFTACGRMGDPVPPEYVILNSPSQLTARGRGETVTLRWEAPGYRADGEPAVAVTGYKIERAAFPPGDPCDDCPADYEEVAFVDAAQRAAHDRQPTAWVDERVVSGWDYRYRVRALDHRGRPGTPSAPLFIAARIPGPPVVTAVGRDRSAKLTIQPPPPLADAPALGLAVYDGAGRLLIRFSPEAAEGRVNGLANGVETTVFARWAVTESHDNAWESEPVALTVTPTDDQPPLPPSELIAMADPAGIFLRWMPARGERYASVRLLRLTGDEAVFREIAQVKGNMLSHLDTEVSAGLAYRYRAVAVDAAGNESREAAETMIRLPEDRR